MHTLRKSQSLLLINKLFLSALQDSLCVAYDYFRSLVMERRKIKKEDFKDIATGKIFVGKQALESSLVDKIGDELDAIEWHLLHVRGN